MDDVRFDALARNVTHALCARPTRRNVTRALASFTLAGALRELHDFLTLAVKADEKHRKKKRRRKKRKKPICRANATFCANAVACQRSGERCVCGTTAEGRALCVSDQDFCAGFTQCDSSAQCTAPRSCVDISGCCAQPLPSGSRTCLLPCANPR